MFLFTSSPQIKLHDTAILHAPDTKALKAIRLRTFVEQAKALKDYEVSKLPSTARSNAISHSLLPQRDAESLDALSLSDVFCAQGSVLPSHEPSSEHLRWSIMDHVLAYPYMHPDGYVPGTPEYHNWRISVQKQYAFLLQKQIQLDSLLKEVYRKIRAAFDAGKDMKEWAFVGTSDIKLPCAIEPDAEGLMSLFSLE